MADYIRARSPEHKRERMDTIMEAADALFRERPYHQITMGTIAESLGWSRSNLYKYAATQEEIFLALHSAKNRAWLEELAAELEDAPMPAPEFARIWAEVTERNAGFLRYQEILISIIESNVTLERLTAFKRDFADMLPPVADVLARQCGIDGLAQYEVMAQQPHRLPRRSAHGGKADPLGNQPDGAERRLAGLDHARGQAEGPYRCVDQQRAGFGPVMCEITLTEFVLDEAVGGGGVRDAQQRLGHHHQGEAFLG